MTCSDNTKTNSDTQDKKNQPEETKAKYTASHIANFFIDEAKAKGEKLTFKKLNYLVFLAYGFYLASTGKKLFDEKIEHWKEDKPKPKD